MERLQDPRYAADALHVLLNSRLPGSTGEAVDEGEVLEELQYAGELMVVQFFSSIRTFLKPR